MNKSQSNIMIMEAAAAWAVRLEAGDLTAEENAALAEWLQESARHSSELLMATAILTTSIKLDKDRRIDVDALIERANRSVISLSDDDGRETVPGSPDRKDGIRRFAQKFLWAPGLAAAAALLIMVGVSFRLIDFPADPGRFYTTERGELRSLTLEDGSVIHINTQSKLHVQFTKTARVLRLTEGEAMFEIAHDANRPFQVIAGDTVVQAVGTEFNVYRQDDKIDVTVIEGKVAVLPAEYLGAPPSAEQLALLEQNVGAAEDSSEQPYLTRAVLTVGQEATIFPDGKISKVSMVDPSVRTSWLRRMLVFRNAPLSQVVREFNRYNGLQIHIYDPVLAETPLTAALRADNPQALLDLIVTSDGIVLEHRGSNDVIIRRGDVSKDI